MVKNRMIKNPQNSPAEIFFAFHWSMVLVQAWHIEAAHIFIKFWIFVSNKIFSFPYYHHFKYFLIYYYQSNKICYCKMENTNKKKNGDLKLLIIALSKVNTQHLPCVCLYWSLSIKLYFGKNEILLYICWNIIIFWLNNTSWTYFCILHIVL